MNVNDVLKLAFGLTLCIVILTLHFAPVYRGQPIPDTLLVWDLSVISAVLGAIGLSAVPSVVRQVLGHEK